jgi:hypothetical protein
LQSGSFLSIWAFQRNPKDIAFAAAAFLNDTFQTNTNSNDLLEFLQNVDAKDIDVASEQYASSVRISGTWFFCFNGMCVGGKSSNRAGFARLLLGSSSGSQKS